MRLGASFAEAQHLNIHCRQCYRNNSHCAATGSLPQEFAELYNLKLLNVADNYLTGTLPAQYFRAAAFNVDTYIRVCYPQLSLAVVHKLL